MPDPSISYTLEGPVAIIGLCRANKRNAINLALMDELADAVERAGREARVGILYGEGEHFCAGLDLAEAAALIASGEWGRRHALRSGRPRLDALARGPIPFIAALRGAVIGGGFELAASCHIRVMDDSAFFALPEARRGIYLGGGGSIRIARLIGYGRMSDMMLTGRVYGAEEAEPLGFAQYLVPDPLEKAREIAQSVALNSHESNFAITNGLARLQDVGYDDGLFWEQLLVSVTGTPETEARLEEFLQGRARVALKGNGDGAG